MTRTALRCAACVAALSPAAVFGRSGPISAGCAFEPQGEGRVAAVIDRADLSASMTAAKSASPASSRPQPTRPAAGRADRNRRRTRGDAARRRRHAGPLRPPAGIRVPRPALKRRCRASCCRRGEALVSTEVTDKDCAADLAAAEAEARRGQNGHLGGSSGHKKRGKSGRYFGRDWALYGGRGQSFVRSAGRGNDLPEFRTELDTGLCCDYFKAHDAGVRGCRTLA